MVQLATFWLAAFALAVALIAILMCPANSAAQPTRSRLAHFAPRCLVFHADTIVVQGTIRLVPMNVGAADSAFVLVLSKSICLSADPSGHAARGWTTSRILLEGSVDRFRALRTALGAQATIRGTLYPSRSRRMRQLAPVFLEVTAAAAAY